MFLIIRSSWFSMFLKTFSAINGSIFVWFEWNFAFFTTIGTVSFMHFSVVLICQYYHSYFSLEYFTLIKLCEISLSYCKKNLNIKNRD